MTDITIAIALSAGFVSFLSPCVLPIIPGFLSYLAGSGAGETPSRKGIFFASVFFVLGFASVFSVLGVLLNTLLESVAYEATSILSKIGGAIIIAFGLSLIGILKIPFLEREYKFSVKKKFSSKYVTAFVFGAAFAAGWTPCVGAALGSILALAATNPGSSFSLLFSYSLGLGLPFLLVGAFAGEAQKFINRFAGALVWVNRIFGVLLVGIGILAFTETLSIVANFGFINSILLK